ncbi:hypothetical protein QYF36_000516 [Acer negundo]|nr:hypothetical protein QYF36_000516 [Acer negundo]
MMEVEAIGKERDEAIKKAEGLTRLVEEQKEDFAQETRKIQWQMELKDKIIDALKEESCKTEDALRVAKVKECDYLVTIKILTKEQGIKGENVGHISKGDSSHPNAKKQSKPRGKQRRIRQVWVRKDKLDQARETITDGKKALDMEECPKLFIAKGGSTSGEVIQLKFIALIEL